MRIMSGLAAHPRLHAAAAESANTHRHTSLPARISCACSRTSSSSSSSSRPCSSCPRGCGGGVACTGGVQGGRVQALHGCPALPASYLHLHLLGLHAAQAQCHHACASWRHACRLLCPSSKLRQQKIRHKEGELGHSKRQANGQLPDDLHVDLSLIHI